MTDEEPGVLAKELHQIIVKAVPKTSFLAKYGGVLYTVMPREKDNHFCGVFIHKDHVQIVFNNGSRLTDRAHVLLGQGRSRRHINFYSAKELRETDIVGLLRQAAKQ